MGILSNKLEKLSKDQLVQILDNLSSQSKAFEKEIKVLLASYDPKEFYKLVSKEVTSITSNKKFYNYWECRDFANKIIKAVKKIEDFLVESEPDLAIKLAKRIIAKEERIAENIDDSSGEVGYAFENFFSMLDRAFFYAKLEPKELAQFIHSTYLESQYGYNEIILQFSKCIDDEVLIELENMLVPVCGLKANDTENYKFDYDEHFHKFIADKRKDVDAYIAIVKAKEGLDNAHYLLEIAKRLIEAFREDDAIEYLNKIAQENFYAKRDDLLIEAYLLDGNIIEVKKIYYNQIFNKLRVNTSAYLKYVKYANSSELEKVRKEIVEYINARPFAIETIETLDALGEYDLLEDSLVDFVKSGKELNLHFVTNIRKASTAIAKEKPLASVLIRRLLVNDCLDGKKSKYYDYAVSDFKKSVEFGDGVVDWRGVDDGYVFYTNTFEKHKKKYSFWDRIVDAGVKAMVEKIYL